MVSELRHVFVTISEWFYENYILLNADKCHSITVSFNEPFPDFSVSYTAIGNITDEKVFGTVIDNKLNFKSHLKTYAKRLTKNSVHSQEYQNY